jgi:RNA polymerase sigma-70 factor (ECF subfamily)
MARGITSLEELRQKIAASIPSLRRYACALLGERDDADDLVHDTLVRAMDRLHLYRPGSDLRAWLFAILHNQHIDAVRRKARRPDGLPIDDQEAAAPASQDDRLTARDLDRALALLPEEQRQVVLLVGLEGLAYAEVASVLGVPLGTVMSRLNRGRQRLRSLMEQGPASPIRRIK